MTLNKKNIRYYSTNLNSDEVSFSEALMNGLAPDGGLYLPKSIPTLTKSEFENFPKLPYFEVAFQVLYKLIGDEISKEDLLTICTDAYNYAVPLEKVRKRMYVLRLDQGPTASFKDFAARVMSRLMQHFLALKNKNLTILTATSGDTGSAVASAFYGLKNINVIILFPRDEVSSIQRKQMTTLNGNIKVIAIDGKFDDCQRLVKNAFLDPDLSHLPLSSANSINIGRLLPQTVYYIYAWSRLAVGINDKVIFSVPSGNFGNLMGGLIAMKMGLPVNKFVIATNDNNEVPEFLKTGSYKSIEPSINCISSAMNVGHPSNLARIIALYNGLMDESGNIKNQPDLEKMRKDLYGISVTDKETRQIIEDIYRKYNIVLEPHGAVAWFGINQFLSNNSDKYSKNQLCIALETAHPGKFPDALPGILKDNPPLPESLSGLESKAEVFSELSREYPLLKKFILKNIN